jgi:hypothetical protein
VLAESINCSATDFKVLTRGVVAADLCLNFIAHCLFNRSLASNCCAAGCFSATPCGECVTAMTRFDSAKLGGSFSSGKRTTQSAF